ncbi:MAG: DUF885 domain-containing protein [Candidatus Bathyarchaeota archaeon]|nr:MAG: DUF885 domain-containing protein [Candidatus Bathyarchaeota archaeon]
MSDDEAFEKHTQEALQQFLKRNPEEATLLGFHEPYDKLLSSGSIEEVYENLKLMEAWRTKMKQTINFDELNEENKMDWKLLENACEMSRFSVYEHCLHEKNPECLQGIGALIFVVLTREYAPFEKRIEGIISRLEKLPLYLEEFRKSYAKCVPVKLWTEVAIEGCQQMPGFFQFLIAVAKGRISEKLFLRLQTAVAGLSQPLIEHLEWLKALLPKAKADWALGKEKFERLLKLRELGMSADEIYELGVKYLKELREERVQLAEKISPGKTVEEVMKQIQADAPKTYEEALEFTRKEMKRAKKFVREHNIAAVPMEDKLHVEETPLFIAPLVPFAALAPPGKYERVQEGIYVVTRPKDMKDLSKDANYASIRNAAVHEAYPGHFLQISRSNRLGSFIRALVFGLETVEGWAHYCEEMMMEHGFQRGLESRFIQVNNIIWRAVRMMVDVKLSCGEMSFDEAVDMLVKETGMSKNGAVAEVRRYTQSPGYPLSYLLGKHLMLKLQDDLKARIGDKYSDKFFHDVVTANGNLPMSKLREIFEQKLGKI